MKKHILLTTTAMLLSAVALKANADSNSAQLEIQAEFIKPFELISEQYLGFGSILADGGGKTVVVKSDGSLGEESTATMISKATFKNSANGFVALGSLNEGLIRAKGFLNDDRDGHASQNNMTPEFLNYIVSVNISDTAVELTSTTDSVSCGTVSNFTTNITTEGNDALVHIGGTLTTANLSETTRSLHCYGYTTVTVVYNEENLAALQNSRVENGGI